MWSIPNLDEISVKTVHIIKKGRKINLITGASVGGKTLFFTLHQQQPVASLDLLGLENCFPSLLLTLLQMERPWDGNTFTHTCSSCREVLEVVEMYDRVGKMAIKFYYQIKPHS